MMQLSEPPAQYDHPFHGHVIEQRLSLLQMMHVCHGPAGGCSWVSHGTCYIALPQSETDRRLIALMRRHEIGHCNGWPADHPDARSVNYDPDKRSPTYKFGRVSMTLF